MANNYSVISCHLNSNPYLYDSAAVGTTVNFSNTQDVAASNTAIDLPDDGPLAATDLQQLQGTNNNESCEHHEVHWCGDGVIDAGSAWDNPVTANEQCDPATEAGGTPVFAAGFSAATHTCNNQCQAIAIGAPSCSISASPNPITA